MRSITVRVAQVYAGLKLKAVSAYIGKSGVVLYLVVTQPRKLAAPCHAGPRINRPDGK